MKLLKFKIQCERNVGTSTNPKIEYYQQDKVLCANIGNYEIQMAEAKKHAYQGIVTVEDVQDEPHAQSVEEQQRLNDLETAVATLFYGGGTV